jgi:hypothetical protein
LDGRIAVELAFCVSGWRAGWGQLLTLVMHYQGDRFRLSADFHGFRLQTLNVRVEQPVKPHR